MYVLCVECDCNGFGIACHNQTGMCYCNDYGVSGEHCTKFVHIVVIRAVRLLEQLQLLVIVASQSQLCD